MEEKGLEHLHDILLILPSAGRFLIPIPSSFSSPWKIILQDPDLVLRCNPEMSAFYGLVMRASHPALDYDNSLLVLPCTLEVNDPLLVTNHLSNRLNTIYASLTALVHVSEIGNNVTPGEDANSWSLSYIFSLAPTATMPSYRPLEYPSEAGEASY